MTDRLSAGNNDGRDGSRTLSMYLQISNESHRNAPGLVCVCRMGQVILPAPKPSRSRIGSADSSGIYVIWCALRALRCSTIVTHAEYGERRMVHSVPMGAESTGAAGGATIFVAGRLMRMTQDALARCELMRCAGARHSDCFLLREMHADWVRNLASVLVTLVERV